MKRAGDLAAETTVNVAIFTIDPRIQDVERSLAVIFAHDAQGLYLPNVAPSETAVPLETDAQRAVLGFVPSALGDKWAEPFVEQVTAKRDLRAERGLVMRIGFSSLAHLTEVPDHLTLVHPDAAVNNSQLPVEEMDREIIAAGLDELRRWVNHKTAHEQDERVVHDKTLRAVARLVEDPQFFTITNLRRAFGAVRGLAWDERNFERSVVPRLDLEHVGEVRTAGRTAKAYTLPARGLLGLSSDRGKRPAR